MNSSAFIFPTVKGVQAQREYYISMVPLDIIAKIFQFADEELPPEIRAQRILNKSRIPEIRDYILSNPESYVFSALTVSVDGEMEFNPLDKDNLQIGTISILVSMMHVNSETGIIQPIEEIGAALEKTKTYFHVDATQGFGKLNDSLRNTKYDMLSITAHKLGGPQGVGAFIMRRDRTYKRPPVKQLMYGGQQERGYRPGTTPVALVAGFALASELCDKEAVAHMENCKAIKRGFLEAVKGLNYSLNGDQKYCLPSTINISFHGVDAEGIFLATKEDYAFSNGSACNSGSHASSYVLKAMGLDESRISEAVRISWNHNTEADFSALVNYIKAII